MEEAERVPEEVLALVACSRGHGCRAPKLCMRQGSRGPWLGVQPGQRPPVYPDRLLPWRPVDGAEGRGKSPGARPRGS